MNTHERVKFDKWFLLRFPHERVDGGYYRDWVYRYDGKGPATFFEYMDEHSEKLWWQVCRGQV